MAPTVAIANHDRFHAEIFHLVETAKGTRLDLRFRRVLFAPHHVAALSGDPLDTFGALRSLQSIKSDLRLNPEDLLFFLTDSNLHDDEDDEYFFFSDAEEPSKDRSPCSVLSSYFLNPKSTFMRDGEQWWKSLGNHARHRYASDAIILLYLGVLTTELTALKCHPESRGCMLDYCQTPTDLVVALRSRSWYCTECKDHLQKEVHGPGLLEFAEALHKKRLHYRSLATDEFDVFLCHNSKDKPAVREICEGLKARGIVPWLDEEQLRPGLPWQPLLEQQIEKIKAAAVFIGDSGIGPWQDMEQQAFIRRFVSRSCPVIPVILAASSEEPRLPVFLEGMTRADFRRADPDPMDRLVWGITGEYFQ